VPADVPVDQPQGALSSSRGAWTADAWYRWFWLWDVYFGVSYVALVGLMLNADEPTPAAKAIVVTAMTLMALWYVAYGRGAILAEDADSRPNRGRIFIAGEVGLLAVAALVEGTASFGLFAVCPLIFMSVRLREAIAVMVLANLLPVLTVLVNDGVGERLVRAGAPTLLTLAFGLLLGTWINRIVAQSEERGKLIKELEASREEVGRLSREAGMTAERVRLAAEIHDTLAQGFTSLVTLVQAAESELDSDQEKVRRHLRLAARTARENLGEARALVAGLMPTALGTASLDEAIRRQLERLAEETSIRTGYEEHGEIAELPTGLEVVLLRTVQESLTNARKHSGASTVTVRLLVDDTTASLRVTDDGSGFDPGPALEGFEAFGLRGMRARAEQVGGSLEIHSGPAGTTLTLEVPR
jgi:signal transduction histidine kinase